jgi:hypothetical protein
VPSTPDVNALVAAVKNDRVDASYQFRLLSKREQVGLVQHATVEHRYDILTLVPDATPLVQALSVPDLYVLVDHEHMNSRIQSILEVATPEQLRGVMDFSCWEGDEPDPDTVLDWFEWLVSLSDDQLRDRLRTLDASFVASAIGPYMTPSASGNLAGGFTVIATKVDALPDAFSYDEPAIEYFAARLYDVDLELFDEIITRIFKDDWTEYRGTDAAMPDQVGEATHLRAARLRELELRDTYEARTDLLQPLELHLPLSLPVPMQNLPVPLTSQPMLDAMTEATGDAALTSEWRIRLARLAGDIVMARGGNPANRRDLEYATGFAQASVNIALDALSGGSPYLAVVMAETWSWRDLFRAGNTLLERLRWRVDSIDDSAIPTAELHTMLDGLFRVPMRVWDPVADEYRLPQYIAELQRAHRAIHSIQTKTVR